MPYRLFQKLGHERVLLLIELYLKGLDYCEIARQLKLPKTPGKATIHRYICTLGVPKRDLELHPQVQTMLESENKRREELVKRQNKGRALILRLGLAGRDGAAGSEQSEKKIRA